MHFIIVDNGSLHLPELVSLCGPERSTVVTVADLPKLQASSDTVFVLSGSHNRAVHSNEDYYQPELNLIAMSDRPIIGICLGFELIAHQGGAKLVHIDRAERGIIEIKPTPEGMNWFGPQQFRVSESHHWVVRQVPPGYVSLATSTDGIEAIASLTRRIVGFQFHPERDASGPGTEIFYKVLSRLTSK